MSKKKSCGRNAGTESDRDLLQESVAEILRCVPQRWEEFEPDAHTAMESKALFLLVAAGMVERRGVFRLRLNNHPVAVEGTFEATGEYGYVEAMRYVVATMWHDWKDAFANWKSAEPGDAPAFWCECLRPQEWRLTEQGDIARSDLDGDESYVAIDFVLRRGFFDGRPRLNPSSGRITRPESVRGTGKLVGLQRLRTKAISPPEVKIGNWKEGAEAFAEALEPMIRGNGRAEPGELKLGSSIPESCSNAPENVATTQCELEVLMGLAKHGRSEILPVDIPLKSEHGLDTIRAALSRLEVLGFVARPQETQRKGYGITTRGLTFLREMGYLKESRTDQEPRQQKE